MPNLYTRSLNTSILSKLQEVINGLKNQNLE